MVGTDPSGWSKGGNGPVSQFSRGKMASFMRDGQLPRRSMMRAASISSLMSESFVSGHVLLSYSSQERGRKMRLRRENLRWWSVILFPL